MSAEELYTSSITGDLHLATELLAKGVRSSEMVDGSTPLHGACEHGHVQLVRLLIPKSDNLDTPEDVTGLTALHKACGRGQVEVARLLCAEGASVDARDLTGFTPLHHSASMGHASLINDLHTHGADLNCKGNNGSTPLHVACTENHVDVVLELLERNAALEALNDEDMTPLHCAVIGGAHDTLSVLIDHGAKLEAISKGGWKALHFACDQEKEAIAQTLLHFGACADVQNDRGNSPLHYAARNGSCELIRILLNHGANIDCRGRNGMTPLHFACYVGQEEAVQVLLDLGADANALDSSGKTALQIAKKRNFADVAKILENRESRLLEGHTRADSSHTGGNYQASTNQNNAVVETASVEFKGQHDDEGIHQDYADVSETNRSVEGSETDASDMPVTIMNSSNSSSLLLDAPRNESTTDSYGHSSEAGHVVPLGGSVSDPSKSAPGPHGLAAAKFGKSSADDDTVSQPPGPLPTTNENDSSQPHQTNQLHISDQENNIGYDVPVVVGVLVDGRDALSDHGATFQAFWPDPAEAPPTDSKFSTHNSHRKKDNHSEESNGLLNSSYRTQDPSPPPLAGDVIVGGPILPAPHPTSTPQTAQGVNGELMEALRNGNVDFIVESIQNGTSIDATDSNGDSLLHEASKIGNEKVVVALLNLGANVDFKNKLGNSPLHVAIRFGNANVVTALVDRGAEVNIKGFKGATPLHWASFAGNGFIAKYLIDSGADPTILMDDGKTALEIATIRAKSAVVQVLEHRDDTKLIKTEVSNLTGSTTSEDKKLPPQRITSFDGIPSKKVPTLIPSTNVEGISAKMKIESNTESPQAQPSAAEAVPQELASSLPEKNALLSRIWVFKKPASTTAATTTTTESSTLSLPTSDTRPDVQGPSDGNMEKPSFEVKIESNKESVQAQLSATEAVAQELASSVPEKNALRSRIWAFKKPAKTAAATTTTAEKSTQSLPSNDTKPDDTRPDIPGPSDGKLREALQRGDVDEVQRLLRQGATVHEEDANGDTPLHQACSYRYVDVVKALIDAGADVNARNNNSNTPLHVAVRYGHMNAIETLVSRGADVDSQGFSGTTPLHWATYTGNLKAVRLLLAEGAHPRSLTKDGKTPLVLARERGLTEIAEIFEMAPSKFFAVLFSKYEQLGLLELHDKLIRCIGDVHEMKIYYTLLRVHTAQKLLSTAESRAFLKRALESAAIMCQTEDAIARFKVVLMKCRSDKMLDDVSFHKLDNRAEVTRMEHADFIVDMRTAFQRNATRIDSLEASIKSIICNIQILDDNIRNVHSNLEKAREGIRRKMQRDIAFGVISCVVNLITLGIGGTFVSGATKLIFDSVVDFGDALHITDIINSELNPQDATVCFEAFSQGISVGHKIIEGIYNHRTDEILSEAMKDGNPIVALGLTTALAKAEEPRLPVKNGNIWT